jgi:hypothetical protein
LRRWVVPHHLIHNLEQYRLVKKSFREHLKNAII